MNRINVISNLYDAVLFDVGNTLVRQADPGTPVSELRVDLLPGVREVVESLRGNVKLGVVSNTSSMTGEELLRFLQSAGIGDAFDVVVATADLGVHKPDPLPLVNAINMLDVQPKRTLYVGDNDIDRIAAERAGTMFCFTGPHLGEALLRHGDEPGSAWLRACMPTRRPVDGHARAVLEHLDRLVKPAGSLGALEAFVARIASVQHTNAPAIDPCGAVVFCADHGIAVDDTVTPWPQDVSAIMSGVIASGRAVSSVFSRSNDIYLEVIDVGLARQVSDAGVRDEAVRRGTADLRNGRAMSRVEAIEALEVGSRAAERLIGGGSRFLCVGEVGIGNTTVSAALISHLCGLKPSDATGRGAGIDDETLERKRAVVSAAVESVTGIDDPIEVMARIGGLEVAAMAGFILASTGLGIPVLLDGVVTQAAACFAAAIDPQVVASCFASHCSAEPASRFALEHLGLDPILSLGLRLGEGTGAMLAVPILRAVCRTLSEAATLDQVL